MKISLPRVKFRSSTLGCAQCRPSASTASFSLILTTVHGLYLGCSKRVCRRVKNDVKQRICQSCRLANPCLWRASPNELVCSRKRRMCERRNIWQCPGKNKLFRIHEPQILSLREPSTSARPIRKKTRAVKCQFAFLLQKCPSARPQSAAQGSSLSCKIDIGT